MVHSRILFFLSFLLQAGFLQAQHTFSIVAVDSVTREIGSAGATCGDSIIWPGTKGALVISDVIPGVGAIHTQALYIPSNQANARNRMNLGDSPQEIIDWLGQNDAGGDSSVRQYGIVDYNAGSPRSAAFTGAGCMDYKNHITGPGYSIQGNILLDQSVLDSMEARFLRSDGCLAEKLMAAMQGAKVIGADTRCAPEGTSSLSAFLRMAKPNDAANNLFIDINVAGTPDSVEPIDVLQSKFDAWKQANGFYCFPIIGGQEEWEAASGFSLYPNPAEDHLNLSYPPGFYHFSVLDYQGRIVFQQAFGELQVEYDWQLHDLPPGIYQIRLMDSKGQWLHQSFVH
ncbi:DUF1028 domain-containing protein [bacterium SCSIO 12741]|nr:DUF1028 domain-containing protein [bacterium SCSIO 12741]